MTDHVARLERVQATLTSLEVDALLVTDLVNVQYLTGFTGTNGQVFVSNERSVFLTDPRYAARAGGQVKGAEIEVYGSRLTDSLMPLIKSCDVSRLGIEAKTMTLHAHEDLQSRLAGVALVPTSGVVENMRRVKDVDEVEALRAAVALGDRAFSWVLDRLIPGVTERAIALDLETKMREWGADGVSFPPIVGSGELSAHIHHTPTEREFQKGDLVLLDFGCQLDGYCSDLTRTVVLGPASDQQAEMYRLVLQAQEAGIAAVAPSATGPAVDKAARSLIDAAGRGEEFGHGLGHGVGLEVHEEPRLSRISEDTLATGNIVTVEPGVYVQGTGGIRIEDCVLVTADGREVLGSAPKEQLLEL